MIALVGGVGCRQLLGIDSPILADAAGDASSDSADAAADSSTTIDALTWACGTEPPTPPSVVTDTAMDGVGMISLQLTDIAINGGAQLAVVAVGSTVTYQFNYVLTDTTCASDCTDQIEIGTVPGGRLACPFDGVVNKDSGVSGMKTKTFTAPATAGVYDVRVNVGQDYSCNANGLNEWWPTGTPPPADLTFATLCVQ